MTTIAYKDGVLAADRAATSSDAITGQITKIARIDGLIVATAGNGEDIPLFHDWLRAGRPKDDKPKISEHFVGLAIEVSTGDVFMYEDALTPFRVEAPFYARGSGRDFALGAMAMGATAEEAVGIACQYDCYSRGPIDVLRLDEP